jgi:hypothetical protein
MALAHAQLALGDLANGKLAFRAGILMAPNDTHLIFWRCQLGLGLWAMLDDNDRQLVASQLRMAWLRQPVELVGLAKSRNNVAPIIATALAEDSEQKSAFEKALAR